MQQLVQYIRQNVDLLLAIPLPVVKFVQLIFIQQNKGIVEQLFGMLSRRADCVEKQALYISYCAQLVQFLNDTEDQQESTPKQGKKTVLEIQTMTLARQEATHYLEEYSFLVYAGVIATQLVPQLSKNVENDKRMQRLFNLTIKAQTTFAAAFPTDIEVSNEPYSNSAYAALRKVIDNLKMQPVKSVEKVKRTFIICLTSLVFARPSEYSLLYSDLIVEFSPVCSNIETLDLIAASAG